MCLAGNTVGEEDNASRRRRSHPGLVQTFAGAMLAHSNAVLSLGGFPLPRPRWRRQGSRPPFSTSVLGSFGLAFHGGRGAPLRWCSPVRPLSCSAGDAVSGAVSPRRQADDEAAKLFEVCAFNCGMILF